MGVAYEQLEELAFLVFYGFSQEVQDKLEESTIQKILEKAFSDTDAVRLLSIEKDDYKKELFSLYRPVLWPENTISLSIYIRKRFYIHSIAISCSECSD